VCVVCVCVCVCRCVCNATVGIWPKYPSPKPETQIYKSSGGTLTAFTHTNWNSTRWVPGRLHTAVGYEYTVFVVGQEKRELPPCAKGARCHALTQTLHSLLLLVIKTFHLRLHVLIYIWHTLTHLGTIWHNSTHLGTHLPTLAHLDPPWHTLAQLSTPWYIFTHLGTPWHNLAQLSTPWYTSTHLGTPSVLFTLRVTFFSLCIALTLPFSFTYFSLSSYYSSQFLSLLPNLLPKRQNAVYP